MSNSVICPSCNTENAFGSNFCNKCGSRLPPGSTIICAICQTPNPSNRFYCDNCGTRLVQEDLSSSAGQGESDEGGDSKVFSLPTRKPGDTGELDPRAVPDWLRTGKLGGDDEEAEEEQVVADASPPVTGKLPRIEELTSEKKGTADLPDWLVSELDSEPIIQPSPITTEYYQDLLGEHDDLISPEEVAAAREEADLPGWLSKADQTAKLPPLEQEPEGPDEDLSDWLADLGRDAEVDFTQEAAEVIPGQVGEPGSGEIDWLSDLGSPNTDMLSEPDEAGEVEPDSSGLVEEPLPDWLAELGPPNTGILSEADESQDFAGGARIPTGDEIVEWDSEFDGGETTYFSPPAEDDETPLEKPDWLVDYSVLQTGALPPEEDVDASEAEDMFPAIDKSTSGWLPESDAFEIEADDYQDDESEESAEEVEEEISEWLDKLTREEPEDLIPLEGEQLPDWLVEPSQSSFEAQSQIDSETQEQVDELMQAADLQMTAWMSSIPGAHTDDLVPTGDESLPEWLKQPSQSSEKTTAEPQEQPESEPAEIPEWLSEPGLISDDRTSDAGVAIDQTAEAPETSEEEISEWLSKLTSEEPDDLIPEDSEKLPDWLAQPTSASFDTDSEIDSEVREQVDELMQAADLQMTAWLSNITGDEQSDDLVSLGDEKLPDWLTEPTEAGLELANEVEIEIPYEAELVEDEIPSWLTEPGPAEVGGPAADVLPEQTDEFAAVENAELPEWLQPPAEITESQAAKPLEEDLSGWIDDLEAAELGETAVADEFQPIEELAEQQQDTTGLIDAWFADLKEDLGESESDASGELIDDLFAVDETAGRSGLDWLTEPDTSELPEVALEAELPTPAAEEELDELSEPEEEFEELPLTGEPDWLSELESLDSDIFAGSEAEAVADEAEEELELELDVEAPLDDELTAEVASEIDELFEAVAPEAEPQAEEYAEDGWLMDESLFEETSEGNEVPDWMDQLGAPMADQPVDSTVSDELVASDEMPEWVASLRPTGDSDMSSLLPSALTGGRDIADMAEEMGEAELPDWLQADDETMAGQPAEGDSTVIELPGVPAWLKSEERESPTGIFALGDEAEGTGSEWADVLGALPPTVPLVERLARAEIPDWIQELKPRELTGEEVELEPETTGPLSGMRGVIDVEPIISTTHVAQPLSQFTVTKEQQQQAALLRQLASYAEERADVVTLREIHTPSAWVRIVLSVVLLVAIAFGLLWPDFLRSDPPPLTPEIEAVDALLQAAAGQPVLVAIEYSPAMAGELTPQASMLLEQLAANGSPIITVSQFAAGTAIASELAGDLAGHDLGLISGEAVGLRQLGLCLANDGNCNNLSGRQLDAALQRRLAEVGLVVIFTGERDSLVNWIEQVGAVNDIPLVVGVTQSLAPVVTPYQAADQVQGVLAGINDTIVYQREFQADGATAVTQQLWIAQNLARVLTAVLLIIGALYYGVSERTVSKPKATASKS